ncbi:MAG: hypothetical protein ABJH98_05790 [Reichenbachiella sp.]|uniref:hypothetical protein n=1 Tax=Reichenbachiella sp. TaxID=2184521 RepID=UPI003297F556
MMKKNQILLIGVIVAIVVALTSHAGFGLPILQVELATDNSNRARWTMNPISSDHDLIVNSNLNFKTE